MMAEQQHYHLVSNLLDAVSIPEDGITSRPIYQDGVAKVLLFAFDQGQELSEHTASMPAGIHVLQGVAVLTLGSDTHEAQAGTWIHMDPHLPHRVLAKTPMIMLLTLLKSARAQPPDIASED